MKRVSQQIADWLVDHGITQCYTVTGGGSMFLNFDICSHPKINTVFMHHEQSCSMAAEAYARITNKPALLLTTTGPGAINAFNGVYGAYTDSIPMLVISGQVKSDTCLDFNPDIKLRQLGDQEGPTVKMVKPITKQAELIKHPGNLELALPRALEIATMGRPGPVWLDIPIDIQNSTQQLDFVHLDFTGNKFTEIISADIPLVKDLLMSSNRPLILAGTGVRLSGAQELLLTFAEKHQIPIATAWTHDLISSDHKLFVGRPGTIGTRPGNFCLQAADLVIVIGSRLNIRQTGYNYKDFAKNACIVHVDIDMNELYKNTVPTKHKIPLDAKQFLIHLDKCISKTKLPNYNNWITWCKTINLEYDVVKEHLESKPQTLNPYIVVNKIFNALRPDDIIVCGNASACIIPFQIGKLQSKQRLFSNSGSASMGYDLPAAIGAASASSKRIICFAGDGSILMNIQELQTIKTLALDIIIIVLNNSGYLSIKQTHENFFGRIIGATPESGVEFPDYCKVANSFGIDAITINPDNIDKLKHILERSGPYLINITVDPEQGFAPRLKAKLNADGKFEPLQLDDMFPYLPADVVEKVRLSARSIKAKHD